MKDWRGNYKDLSVHHLMGHQRTGCWMKPRAGQPQNHPPCPRAPARPHVRLSDTPRTGRAAEDVGPCHPSCPDAARRAKDPCRPRRGTFERARRGTSPGGRVAIHCDYLNIGQTDWDPTEPVATRPLVWLGEDGLACFFHDGNKNVVDFVPTGIAPSACHYAYTPFGMDTGSASDTDLNPWRFSSEYADKVLDCVYYNYRHYSQLQGRWTSGDPFVELALADGNSGDVFKDLLFEDMDRSYSFVHNRVVDEHDVNGLVCGSWWNDWFVPDEPGGFDFTQACQNHDDCYGTCGKKKGKCDEDFLKDMNAVCESVPAKITTWCYRSRRHAALSGLSHRYRCTKYPRSNCRRWASIYHLSVDYLGWLAFNAAQKASGCCPSKGN